MKDKKTAKKPMQPSSELTVVHGQDASGHDQPVAESVSTAAPTLVAEGEQPGKKKTKQKKAAVKPDQHGKPPKATKANEEKKPLNFKVPADFRREFKTYASAHDMKLSKLLEVAFESFRKQQGD